MEMADDKDGAAGAPQSGRFRRDGESAAALWLASFGTPPFILPAPNLAVERGRPPRRPACRRTQGEQFGTVDLAGGRTTRLQPDHHPTANAT
jgi:hypothetical protein